MGTETTTPPAPPAGADPYFFGWRMVPRWNPDGSQDWEQRPLTQRDVLHPEEGDFIMQNPAHDRDVHYLKDALEDVLAGAPGFLVLTDVRIDWQIPGLGAHGPDIVVFEGVQGPFDPHRGTFLVRDAGARPVLVVEVTSPSTRDVDLDEKVVDYHRAGVPVYVIADHRERDGRPFVSVVGHRATAAGYVRDTAGGKGVHVESLRVWLQPDGDRVVCLTENGQKIPDRAELRDRERAAAAERDAEKARADAERERADAEKARADAAAYELAELQAELARLRADQSTNTPNS